MLITFQENGTVEFTRNPVLLSLFPDDPKRIERMTDIRFNEDMQQYSILFLKGPFANLFLLWRDPLKNETGLRLARHWNEFIEDHSPGLESSLMPQRGPCVVYFPTYEDAVKVEVAFIDFLRELGYSMA